MTLFRTVGLSMSSHSVVPVISVACWSTVCVLICMHVCMYVCMYVCMHVRTVNGMYL